MNIERVDLVAVTPPATFPQVAPVTLTKETMAERLGKVLAGMRAEHFDALLIYADKEHGSNFEYLTGFVPRFEEGLLLLAANGSATVILGNENLKMARHSRLPVQLLHCPYFSLPNQPMDHEKPLHELFSAAGLGSKQKVGLVGWKMFTGTLGNQQTLFDLPYFIVESIKQSLAPRAELVNATHLFIGGAYGARTTNNANEIAHYEYGANLSSSCMMDAMDSVAVGRKEADLGQRLTAQGQYNTVVTIAATGQRFENANFYPTHKVIQRGDPLSLTTAYKGGLSSRTGFVVADESELPANQSDYLARVAKPYYHAVAVWLESIRIGMKGGELYALIEQVLPKKEYGWHLNPGHLVADEEWMSSPIYPLSEEKISSGMMLQIDIIPSIAGYTGVSAEECVAVASAELQANIRQEYPQLWARIAKRREYIQQVLNIRLSDDVIPLSNTVAYLRPFFLAKDKALAIRN
ncbi:M24 family metallopeptidase [Serratia oryzae]|jgi:Xaa-Pro aminopeptidase|uniref:M24 family metallopeptidase n=1 Tax=Serratia oryzae TaxID=2034155 RepID=UPI0012E179B8|nr:aminopeptidase P family protein [Serratia oryzae]